MKHLYLSWDDSLYLTNQFDGDQGHLTVIEGKTTVAELAYIAGGLVSACNVIQAYITGNSNDTCEVVDVVGE